MSVEAVYRLQGSRAIPTERAGGPWGPSQHGSAPTSLIAHVAESLPASQPMRIARMTIDLMRPVPLTPLEIRTEIIRDGRKIRLLRIELFAENVLVVSGSVLQIRRAAIALPPEVPQPKLDYPPPEQGHSAIGKIARTPFISQLSLRFVKGGFSEPGPGVLWFKVELPIIEGVPTSNVMTAAVAADFCNGVSSVLDFKTWTFINGDLTINFARDPVDAWVLLDAETWLGPDGAGLAFGRLADRSGYFGRVVQSIVLEPRSKG